MAREVKSLAPTGQDGNGFRHREHRSKKNRRKLKGDRLRLLAWQKEKGERKDQKRLRQQLHNLGRM